MCIELQDDKMLIKLSHISDG